MPFSQNGILRIVLWTGQGPSFLEKNEIMTPSFLEKNETMTPG